MQVAYHTSSGYFAQDLDSLLSRSKTEGSDSTLERRLSELGVKAEMELNEGVLVVRAVPIEDNRKSDVAIVEVWVQDGDGLRR